MYIYIKTIVCKCNSIFYNIIFSVHIKEECMSVLYHFLCTINKVRKQGDGQFGACLYIRNFESLTVQTVCVVNSGTEFDFSVINTSNSQLISYIRINTKSVIMYVLFEYVLFSVLKRLHQLM